MTDFLATQNNRHPFHYLKPPSHPASRNLSVAIGC